MVFRLVDTGSPFFRTIGSTHAGRGIRFPVNRGDGGNHHRRRSGSTMFGRYSDGPKEVQFRGRILPGCSKNLLAFACGYRNSQGPPIPLRQAARPANVSADTTEPGMAIILTGPGLPIDAVISSVNVGAKHPSVMNRIATAGGTGVAVQRLGAGMAIQDLGRRTGSFDCPSGDQNSGGTLRIVGPSEHTDPPSSRH